MNHASLPPLHRPRYGVDAAPFPAVLAEKYICQQKRLSVHQGMVVGAWINEMRAPRPRMR